MRREHDESSVSGGWLGRLDDRAELRGAAAGVVAGLGACFVVRHLANVGTEPSIAGVYDVPFVLLSVALLYSGYWLLRSDFDHHRVAHIAIWSLAGFAALVAIGVWLSGGRALDVQGSVALVLDVGTVGASSGLLAGLCGERRRRLFDRDARLAADRAEERFAFLDRLLRHHLLNGVAVVRGHAELLTQGEEDPAEAIEIIRHRSDEIVHLVRNVEALSRTFTGDLPVYGVDPGPPLDAAVESARSNGAVVAVRGDPEAAGRVLANDRLQVVFETVVAETTSVAVDRQVTIETGTRGGEFVARFAFDGTLADDPDAAVDAGPYGDDALGLFIADTLVEYFGGSLEVAVTGFRTVLTVRLPLAD